MNLGHLDTDSQENALAMNEGVSMSIGVSTVFCSGVFGGWVVVAYAELDMWFVEH